MALLLPYKSSLSRRNDLRQVTISAHIHIHIHAIICIYLNHVLAAASLSSSSLLFSSLLTSPYLYFPLLFLPLLSSPLLFLPLLTSSYLSFPLYPFCCRCVQRLRQLIAIEEEEDSAAHRGNRYLDHRFHGLSLYYVSHISLHCMIVCD